MGTFEAFGVRFATGFPLPEISGGESGSDAGCALHLVTPGEAVARFSGACEPEAVVVAELGDGRVSRMERGGDGDHLLTYGDEASLWLSPGGTELHCGPRDVGSPVWRRYLLDTGLGSVALARGGEGLHAGAVATSAGVVAVAAGQGGGKSTLLVELIRRGLPLFTDDLLMLMPAGVGVHAHPGPPLMNLVPRLADGTPAASVGRVLADLGGESWISVERPGVAPGPVAAVVVLDRCAADELSIARLPASPITLLPHFLHSGRDRARARFETCAALASTAVVLHVTAPFETPASETAAALLGDLGLVA